MLIWGVSFIWSKQVFVYLGPMTTIFFRLIISSIFLFILLKIINKKEKIKKEHYKLFAIAAFFEPFLYFICESNGLLLVSATISSAIVSTIPLFAPIFAFLFFRERLKAINFLGLFISFAGIIVMLINKDFQFNASPVGVLFLFGAVFSTIGYSIALRKLSLLYSPFTIVLTQSIFGALYFLPVVLIFEGSQLHEITFSLDFFLPLLYLGLLGSSIAFILYTFVVKRLGVSRSNIYTNIIPVFTAIFSFLILKENITIQMIIGICLVVGGLILTQQKNETAKTAHP